VVPVVSVSVVSVSVVVVDLLDVALSDHAEVSDHLDGNATQVEVFLYSNKHQSLLFIKGDMTRTICGGLNLGRIYFKHMMYVCFTALLSVCEGATTMESPVWIPRGSKFSMLHTWKTYHTKNATTTLLPLLFLPLRRRAILMLNTGTGTRNMKN
jgi:hypothetical protein